MKTFWEERFREEGRIWGDTPSRTAVYAIELFKKAGVRKVLVPGSGYGRNAEAVDRAGFEVTGIEISETAVSLARPGSPDVRYHNGSVLDMPFDHVVYDGIYCFNVLHLFRKNERAAFLQRWITSSISSTRPGRRLAISGGPYVRQADSSSPWV